MVCNTLQIGEGICINRTRQRRAKPLIQSLYVLLLQAIRLVVDHFFCSIHIEGQLGIAASFEEQLHGIFQNLEDQLSHTIQFLQGRFTERSLPADNDLRFLTYILAVVADPLVIRHHMEKGVDHLSVVFLQLQGIDLHQIFCNILVQEIDDPFVLLQLLHLGFIFGEKGIHSVLEIRFRQMRHSLHLFDHLCDSDRRRAQNTRVQEGKAHSLALTIFTRHHAAGQFYQHIAHGQKDGGHNHIKDNMNKGNLHDHISRGKSFYPAHNGQAQGQNREKNSTNYIEKQMDHSCPLCCLSGADT